MLSIILPFEKSEVELLYDLLCWAVETNKIQYFNTDEAGVEKILEKLKAEIEGKENA